MALERTLLIISGVWLLILSATFYWFFSKLNNLVKKTNEKNLVRILDKVFDKEKENEIKISKLGKYIEEVEESGKFHIQKVGLIRFNPFSETGGDHSFSLALLDGKDKGFVITGLHTRERTRLYVKPIGEAKEKYELSKEEQKAIEKARKS